VTTDLDTALWFGLHAIEKVELTSWVGPDGPIDPESDYLERYEAVRYVEHDGPVYLYVFDVPRWDGRGLVQGGQLVDLATAPDPFRRSQRMQVQSACLLAAAHDGDGDLMSLCVGGAPLVLATPLQGAPGLTRSTADLFPAAKIDPWYASFLALPSVYAPAGEPGRVALRRPLPITVYIDEKDESYLEDLSGRGVAVNPLLVHAALEDMQLTKPEGLERQRWEDHPFREATPIVLDCPFLGVTPPVDLALWNLGLLTGDLYDEALAFDFAFDRPLPAVPVRNVIFEFSPLEWRGGWEDVEQSGKPRPTLLRALWIVNNGTEFLIYAFTQDFSGRGLKTIGPIFFFRDPETGQVGMTNVNAQTCPDINQLEPFLVKPFLVGLMLLRYLSPVLKPAACSRLTLKGNETATYLVPVSQVSAVLFRCQDPKGKRDWYALYDSKGQPFADEETALAFLKVRSQSAYGELDADRLREAARTAVETGETSVEL
jgi:hypothetical protein